MLSKISSGVVLGVDAMVVDVEIDVTGGLPGITVVGLPDAAVRESRERVRAAIRNSGFRIPPRRFTINLAPADLRKEGVLYDLPIALGILMATEHLAPEPVNGLLFLGELSLDGAVKPVRGILPMALSAKEDPRVRGLVVPEGNADEAAVVKDLQVYPVQTLEDAVDFIAGTRPLEARQVNPTDLQSQLQKQDVDLSDVKGQYHAKRALEVAASGGHNILFVGPPGSGKTILARRLPTILPDMSIEEALETTKIHSIAGLLKPGSPIVFRRPFRSPHHTVSDAGLVGGGSHPKPGEVSLAHNGVLFLDELPEFPRHVLENLRQPLEDGAVTLVRSSRTLTYPAQIMLVGAMNPCPCGFSTDPNRECVCSSYEIQKYLSRVSGPLLDRIDMHVEVPTVPYKELARRSSGEKSGAVRERVNLARKKQHHRFVGSVIRCNAQMDGRIIKDVCEVEEEGKDLLRNAIEGFHLSVRAYHKTLKVARTIADLAGEERIRAMHVAEAIQYRTLDRDTPY